MKKLLNSVMFCFAIAFSSLGNAAIAWPLDGTSCEGQLEPMAVINRRFIATITVDGNYNLISYNTSTIFNLNDGVVSLWDRSPKRLTYNGIQSGAFCLANEIEAFVY